YTQRDQDVNKPHKASDLKRTDAGRPVYSGGGIEPDKYLAGPTAAEAPEGFGFTTTQFSRLLYARREFEIYAQKYDAAGDKRFTQPSTGRVTVSPNFVVDDAVIADFLEFLKANNRVKVDETAFAKDKEFIRTMIRYRIDETLFGRAEALRRLIPVD